MQIRETAISTVLLLGLLVFARWMWGGPAAGPFGYFAWAAYFAGAVLAFSVVVSSAVGISSLLQRWRKARLAQAAAHFFEIDAAGGKGPYRLSTLIVVPELAVIDVEFRPVPGYLLPETRMSALRAIVNEGVGRVRSEGAPGTWVDALPGALAALGDHQLELRGPTAGLYRYDPKAAQQAGARTG